MIQRFYYDGYVQLLVDVDGIRIFTNEVCDFLQKVPGKFDTRIGCASGFSHMA